MLSYFPAHVARAVTSLDTSLSAGVSLAELPDLVNRTVATGGKRLRPALLFLLADLYDVPADVAAPYARAAELLHCATLVHDDVVDEAPVRRGKPTINARSSNARAVLAGDLLLSRVIGELATLGNLEALRRLSETLERLVDGEWRQLALRGQGSVTREELETIAREKTASLMAWCCWIPAQLAGRPAEEQAAATRFGEKVGLAFQLKDDELDYSTSGEKTFAQDLREGLVNFCTLEMIERFPALQPAIATLLGVTDLKGVSLPWTADQLDVARAGLRQRVADLLTGAREDFALLAPSAAPGNGEHQRTVMALLELLRFFEARPT